MDLNVVTVFIASAIIFLLLLVLVVLFVFYYQKKMLKQKMDLVDIENAHKLELMQATIKVQEQTQMKLAKDLHDDVGALLTATKLQISQLKRQLPTESKSKTTVDLAEEMLENSISTVRRVSHNIMPPTLERFGLTVTLEEFVSQFETDDNIRIHLNSDVGNRRFGLETELEVFRMIKELVNNTIKHAHATAIQLKISIKDNVFSLVFQDNGKGFDMMGVKPGIGLQNLKNRLSLLHGQMTIETKPGQGFKVKMSFPIIENQQNG